MNCQCGMCVEHPADYHPYAACLMFMACHDGNKVQANLDAVVEHGRQEGRKAAKQTIAALEAEKPVGTITTEDESTQPEEGQEFVYRDDLGGGKWSEIEGAEWAARDMHNDYISDVWIGCIWWPVGDLFDVPEGMK